MSIIGRRFSIRVLLALIVTASFGLAVTGPANAAHANFTGWHTVCAQDLTLHSSVGNDWILVNGDQVYIWKFGANGGHAWINELKDTHGDTWHPNGWVINEYFC